MVEEHVNTNAVSLKFVVDRILFSLHRRFKVASARFSVTINLSNTLGIKFAQKLLAVLE